MLAVFEAIERMAVSDIDVLVMGETGTGKELAARCVHLNGPRRNGRFVPVDCGAIPEDLLESEFFGHERGAFTGAQSRSLGLVEFAARGTLFLDEVGNLPARLQGKLLRALQERRIRRVGGTEEFDVDVRVIAASALDLEEEVRQQRFRQDLFYRINVGRVQLPPLRERTEDIPLLAAHFTERYARELGHGPAELAPETIEVFCIYGWPGNVRELQNVIKRVLAMCPREIIGADDLPPQILSAVADSSEGHADGFFELREQQVAVFERHYLSDLLLTHGGDVSPASPAFDGCDGLLLHEETAGGTAQLPELRTGGGDLAGGADADGVGVDEEGDHHGDVEGGLAAEFVGWVQILIYVGAIVILFLFGLMLTKAPIGREALDNQQRGIALLIGLLVLAGLVFLIQDAFHWSDPKLRPGVGSTLDLGESLFRQWVLPFEAVSFLLLAALIGAVVLSRRDDQR